jgi:hypothetical protein
MPRTTHRDRFSDKEPSPRGLASYEVNAGAAVSFSPGANYFRRRREPEPGTTSGARRCFVCEGRPLAPYGTLATSENKRGDPPVRQQAGRGYCPRPLAEQAWGRDYDPYSERGHVRTQQNFIEKSRE